MTTPFSQIYHTPITKQGFRKAIAAEMQVGTGLLGDHRERPLGVEGKEKRDIPGVELHTDRKVASLDIACQAQASPPIVVATLTS
jgi:hypothetical protein